MSMPKKTCVLNVPQQKQKHKKKRKKREGKQFLVWQSICMVLYGSDGSKVQTIRAFVKVALGLLSFKTSLTRGRLFQSFGELCAS